MDDNNLFEANSLGSKYTWDNGQSGVGRILCKLDRAIINEAWLEKFENCWCKALPREVSDHSTLDWNLRGFGNVHTRLKHAKLRMEVALRAYDEDPEDETKLNSMKEASVSLENTRRSNNVIYELVDENGTTITSYEQIRDFTVQYFESKFNGVEQPIDDSIFHYDHESISVEDSMMMDGIPSMEEIKAPVFDLGADSAPGPDGFSGCFYIHCWDVIQQDLVNAITYYWMHKIIPQGVNSSLMILLAKVMGANTLLLATILGGVLDKLVSEEQVAFMKGRNIHENISVASEMVNELKNKRKDGNVGLKLDISQDFDTISSAFVLEVFRKYGFSENWCSWSLAILSSARISILLNGIPEGFFSINRGLRQGDPPSPLIFVLIEDVLSRNLSKIFLNKSMTPMLSKKAASGQTVCRQKSKVYYGGNSLSRCRTITDLLGMEVSTFPDRYLGVQIMPGDAEVSRKFVVAYDKVCCPVKEGGLGITKLSITNKALLMKLWWNIRSSKKKWARFLYAKYTNNKDRIKEYGIKSSNLPGIKQVYKEVDSNTKVILGDRHSTSLYFDIWYKYTSIAEIIGETGLDNKVKVSYLLVNNELVIPDSHMHNFLRVGVTLADFPRPLGGDDCRVWMPDLKAKFSVWDWISHIFNLIPHLSLITSYKAAKGRSQIIKDLWMVTNLIVRAELWLTRNKVVFDKKTTNLEFLKKRIFHLVHEHSVRIKIYMHNSVYDLCILNFFRVLHRRVKTIQPIECHWKPTPRNVLLLCCDGAAKDNPGRAGASDVARDADCNVVGAMSIGLGITNNYMAEIFGIIVLGVGCSMEDATYFG
ncbi:uncharacterized protein LOC113295672 [Papaver somniferum]|uniref:uncharacterized protein LOC113295672 n=1 Tax=Papaver somniferum TaxID=3469 RepID=UPI000E6FBA24|nr:uncharacterized protein LOC113295672 [Papaver somniferum]